MTNTAEVTATDVIRAMYATHLPMAGEDKFDLVGEVYRATATRLGLESDTSAEAANKIGPIAEQALTLMHTAAGIADTGSNDTPECMATIGQVRQVMARAADVSDIRLVKPVEDERRLAHLVDTTPDVD